MANILIMDAQRGIRNTLKERLLYEKYTVEAAATPQEAKAIMERFAPDVVLCDHCCGEELGCPFIVMSDDTSVDNTIATVRAGAADFIPKPIDMNRLLGAIRKALGVDDKEGEELPTPETFKPQVIKKVVSKVQEIIGDSPRIAHVKELIGKVAGTDARVLITGENGTGKELVARWVHELSRRSKGPFQALNCAAIPSELIESQLFGHERGAFSSAVKQQKGMFELAGGGTLFLDEIGDMSLSAQAKVLRVLQENRVIRVGGEKDFPVDVRVVAATNKNLKDEIAAGRFREDLYHRLSVIIIHVPPLRERPGDVAILANHFIDLVCRENGIARKTISAEGMAILADMPWRGNIRELHNVVARLVILGGEVISADDVQTYVMEFV